MSALGRLQPVRDVSMEEPLWESDPKLRYAFKKYYIQSLENLIKDHPYDSEEKALQRWGLIMDWDQFLDARLIEFNDNFYLDTIIDQRRIPSGRTLHYLGPDFIFYRVCLDF